MGLRGIGATKRSAGPKRRRRPTWKRPELSRVDRVVAFLQSLPVTKGIRAGKKMRLLPDQLEFIDKVYGGRARMGILSEPRGNGKTGLVAGLALAAMLGPESEPRGEVYCAAVDRTQSAKLFSELEAIILAVSDFAERCNIKRHEKMIEVLSGDGAGSVFQALSSDSRKGEGLAPSLWIYDELAQVSDYRLLDALELGMGKRSRSLALIISTQAESDDHRLSVMIDDALGGDDPTVAVHLVCADPDADPFDPNVLRACNPAIGHFLNEADLLADLEKARRLPAYEARYRNRRLNQRVDPNPEARLVSAAVWKLGDAPVDRDALRGRRCFGGLDLSGKGDLSALELAFPSDGDDPTYDVLTFAWTPLGALEDRQARERDLFKTWISTGHLIGVPGPVIRSGWIANAIAELAGEFDIQSIAFDRWRVDDLLIDLKDAGCRVPLEPRGQGFKDQGPDLEVLTELALTGRLRHGGHPVLRAAMSNAVVVPDPAGNLKVDKDRASRIVGSIRIDPVPALAMALGLASRTAPKRESVYSHRGVLTVAFP